MPNLLDLTIMLAPPEDAETGVIATFELACPRLGQMRASGVLRDPLTDKERVDLRWYLEEYWQWPYEGFAERARAIERQLEQIGQRLYNVLFDSADAQRIVQRWDAQLDRSRQISLIGDLPIALSLPWELLHDGHNFLTLRPRYPVAMVRRLPERSAPPEPQPFTLPLRVLLVTARPDNAGFIDPRGIARELLDELEPRIQAGAVALEFLRPPTLPALRARLSNPKLPAIHVLHFDGHGAFAADVVADDGLRLTGGVGKLAFERDDGTLDMIEADELASVLSGSGVRLAVLNACQSAQGSEDDAFSSVAARLIKGGVDAVAAMSASVLVAGATKYVEAFYRAVADGQPAPEAQERARQALSDDPRRHIHQRKRDVEGVQVELRDWWLPHFYQQRELQLQPGKPKGKRKPPVAPRLTGGFPTSRYGFTGRAYELLQIERNLLRGKLVVLQGFGGVGKSALAAEAASWLTRTRMYAGALWVSFENGGGAEWLLAELGRHLDLYDGGYNPSDTAACLGKLRPALAKQPTLIIADNLETILPNGDAPLPADERTRLWDVMLALAAPTSGSQFSVLGSPAGLLLTTRDITFGDGRMAPGRSVIHMPLGGLQPDDAYTFATQLLKDLGIDRRRAPFVALRELLARLDHHPLAMQLVLPQLHDLPLATVSGDLALLLPQFKDDAATGRNASLLASLDYSLRRLAPEQRALLPRLALFENGASEDDLLAITEIPEAEWATLRPALERAALITAERVTAGDFQWTAPFLRFHPVLAPFLRSQPGADDAALRQRYAARYYALSSYLYHEDNRNPQPVRALVRRELPNLRRALDLLLEADELDAAVDMADAIVRFLNNFGLARERDELRRKIEGASNTSGGMSGTLTRAEYLRESGLGEDEFARGNLQAAYHRFESLLTRIQDLPAGTPLGRGSYEHCLTLRSLARCLRLGGQPPAAEARLREALGVIEGLIQARIAAKSQRHAERSEASQRGNSETLPAGQGDNENDALLVSYHRQRGTLLTDLGDVLRDQGKFAEARTAYEGALELDRQLGDERGQGVDLGQLGTLALRQRDYPEAARRHDEALTLFHALNEPSMEAVAWHLLGMVAEEQQQWAEAERCYRESLAITDRLGDAVGVARTCNQLAIVAKNAGRSAEAEGWYKRAIGITEQLNDQKSLAACLNNLADLLLSEVRANRASRARLAEARSYAERALAIIEQINDLSLEPWKDYALAAGIADLEGNDEAARTYRRRERETFAAFAGNRWHIDRQHGDLIAAIAAGGRGDVQVRAAVEAALPQLEANGWMIADATRRIWAGERDWQALVEDTDRNSALLVLRVLETMSEERGARR